MTAARLRTAAPYLVYAAVAAGYCAPRFAAYAGRDALTPPVSLAAEHT